MSEQKRLDRPPPAEASINSPEAKRLDRPDREKKALERIVLFLSIAQETGHKCLYLDVWGNARTLLNDLNALFPDRAQTMDSPDREKIARVICCFANENESCADCKENHPGSLFPDCFSDIREHTDKIIALLEEVKREGGKALG